MGREIRRVPADWVHPKAEEQQWTGDKFEFVETAHYRPLYDKDYETAAQEWLAEFDLWRAGTHPDQEQDTTYFWDFDPPPREENYRERKWTVEEATHYQIYETVTEGTPVSPVFATLDELVEWCVAQGYSRHAAENFAKQGWVPSMMMDLRRGIIAKGIEVAGID
jgi:hypothetical protein